MAKMIVRTRGRQMLLVVLQRCSSPEIASRIRFAESCVREWSSGEATPSPAARVRLSQQYGIPLEAWLQSPIVITAPAGATQLRRR